MDEDLVKNKDLFESYKEKRIYFYQLIACIFEYNMSIIPRNVCFTNNNPILIENLKICASFERENEKEIKSSIFLLKLYDYATKNNNKFVFENEQRLIKLLELSPLYVFFLFIANLFLIALRLNYFSMIRKKTTKRVFKFI